MKKITLLLFVVCLCITSVYATAKLKANSNPNACTFRFKVSAADLHIKSAKPITYAYYMNVTVLNQTSPNWNYPEQVWSWWVTDMYGNTIAVPISGAYITLYANCGNSMFSYSITLPFTQGTTVETTTHNVQGWTSYLDTYVNNVSITTYSPTNYAGYDIGAGVRRLN